MAGLVLPLAMRLLLRLSERSRVIQLPPLCMPCISRVRVLGDLAESAACGRHGASIRGGSNALFCVDIL